jgi:hypothetical protein
MQDPRLVQTRQELCRQLAARPLGRKHSYVLVYQTLGLRTNILPIRHQHQSAHHLTTALKHHQTLPHTVPILLRRRNLSLKPTIPIVIILPPSNPTPNH